MDVHSAVQQGCRIRHRDWSPYQYAELRTSPEGQRGLCKITPLGDVERLSLNPEQLDERQGWAQKFRSFLRSAANGAPVSAQDLATSLASTLPEIETSYAAWLAKRRPGVP